jgi:hypothetical protein
MKTKKFLSLMLTLVLLLSTVPFATTAFATNINDVETLEISVSDDITITANIPSEYSSQFTEQDLIDIAIQDELQDGDVITILDVGGPDSDTTTPAPYLGVSYDTSCTWSGSEWAAQNYFVISVAKGQTTTLTNTFTKTLNVGITVGEPYASANIGASVTATHTITQQFVGPPESSSYNTREFRVQFYARTANWTQIKYDFWGDYEGTRTGTASIPTRWASYSIDRNI